MTDPLPGIHQDAADATASLATVTGLAATIGTALANITAAVNAATAKLADITTLSAGTTPPPPPPPGTVTLTMTVLDANHVRADWATDRQDVTAWTIGRNGVDTNGGPPWSTVLAGPVHTQPFNDLATGTLYTFTLTPHLATGDLPAVTATATPTGTGTPPPPPPPPPGGDGTQAAVLNAWGPVVAGDEFDYVGPPASSKWGMYDGAGHNGNGRRVPSAFSVANGVLTCHGLANGDTGGMAGSWSGVKYRDEVRMRVYNTAGGSGSQYHPVLIRWPNSDLWPRGGEDDFAETDIGANGVQSFIHHRNQDSDSSQSAASKTLDITQFHNYAIESGSTGVKLWIDGVQWASYSLSEVNGLPPGAMHPTIQLDNFGGASHREANMDVMWWRTYGPPA